MLRFLSLLLAKYVFYCIALLVTCVSCNSITTGLNTAARRRYLSLSSIKGLCADVGALQRLPKLIGSQSLVRELCFTARKVDSQEANQCGLVSKVCHDKERYELKLYIKT